MFPRTCCQSRRMRGSCSRLRRRTNSRSGRGGRDSSRRGRRDGSGRCDVRRNDCGGRHSSRRRRSRRCNRRDKRLCRCDDRRGRSSLWDSSRRLRSGGCGGRRSGWNSSLHRCRSSCSGSVYLVGSGARRGSLCEPQRAQQGRYNDQQKYLLHEILRGASPCGGVRLRLEFDRACDSQIELYARYSSPARALGAYEGNNSNLFGKNLSVCSRRLTFRERRTTYRSDSSCVRCGSIPRPAEGF